MSSSGSTFRSKIGNAYPKTEIEDRQPELKANLAAMKKTGRNRQCFDCGVADVTWASPKLGTFICVTCSDVHRAAGAHITCVKNFTTYLWSPDEVELMRAVGNNRAKEIFRPSSDLSWQPAESKEQKVRQCTKLYGTEKAQLAVKRHIEAATAVAGPGAKAAAQGMGYASQAAPAQPASAPASALEPSRAPKCDSKAPDWLGDWPSEKPVANGLASRDVGNDWPVPLSNPGMEVPVVQTGPASHGLSGPWPNAPPAPLHDLIDLFPPSAAHNVPPSKGGDAGTPFQGSAMTAKATEHEKDFWSSVNWDELLK